MTPVGLTFDLHEGLIANHLPAEKRLSALAGCWADPDAYARSLALSDPIVYRVTSAPEASGPGDLGYGLGCLLPGRVGDEYYLTRGHLHKRREAAEVYIGLRGVGLMLLEDERTGTSTAMPLAAGTTVYVPGFVAHRTINVGDEPLIYWGIYPHDAGHDYGFVGERNFRQVVIAVDGQPRVIDRATYLKR